MRRVVPLCALLLGFSAANVAAIEAPLLFTVLDIGGAKSLPWEDPNNFLGISGDYDVRQVAADTEALLTPSTPTIVRMETLRRAAVYVSRDRQTAERLVALLIRRATVLPAPGQPSPAALFDAGYVVEVLNEMQLFSMGTKTLWSIDAIAAVTRGYDARALLEQSAALRPDDPCIQLALGLTAPANEAELHLRRARSGARDDALLANNLARLHLL
jgi:hypothetical protein